MFLKLWRAGVGANVELLKAGQWWQRERLEGQDGGRGMAALWSCAKIGARQNLPTPEDAPTQTNKVPMCTDSVAQEHKHLPMLYTLSKKKKVTHPAAANNNPRHTPHTGSTTPKPKPESSDLDPVCQNHCGQLF